MKYQIINQITAYFNYVSSELWFRPSYCGINAKAEDYNYNKQLYKLLVFTIRKCGRIQTDFLAWKINVDLISVSTNWMFHNQ